MKKTKKLETILERYQVKLRETNTVVEHLVYETKTEIDPLQFACYEATCKAHFVTWVNAPRELKAHIQFADNSTITSHYNGLAQKDNFGAFEWSTLDPKQASDDYYYCNGLISADGLYYELLD
jgi:hypothetical protein